MAKTAKAGPVVTDNGNFVIDAPFEEAMFRDPHEVCSEFANYDLHGIKSY